MEGEGHKKIVSLGFDRLIKLDLTGISRNVTIRWTSLSELVQ